MSERKSHFHFLGMKHSLHLSYSLRFPAGSIKAETFWNWGLWLLVPEEPSGRAAPLGLRSRAGPLHVQSYPVQHSLSRLMRKSAAPLVEQVWNWVSTSWQQRWDSAQGPWLVEVWPSLPLEAECQPSKERAFGESAVCPPKPFSVPGRSSRLCFPGSLAAREAIWPWPSQQKRETLVISRLWLIGEVHVFSIISLCRRDPGPGTRLPRTTVMSPDGVAWSKTQKHCFLKKLIYF